MPGMDTSQNQDTAKSAPQGERKVLYYYDAMNPTFRSPKPGTATDGMPLVPRYADEEEATANMPVGTVKLSQGKQQLIGVTTATVEREPLFRTVRAVAQLTADETKLAHVHLKVNGWIEQVYVDYVGKLVKKGDPLFTLYSPDLVATEQEYLIARRGKQYLGDSSFPDASQGADSLLDSTRERLRLWDISDQQIKELDETGKITRTLTFYSPSQRLRHGPQSISANGRHAGHGSLYDRRSFHDLGQRADLRIRSALRPRRSDGPNGVELLSGQEIHRTCDVHLSHGGSANPHRQSTA